MKKDLSAIGTEIQNMALKLGADEVRVSVSQSVSTELTQREGKLEKSKQANSLGVGLEILVDDKFSSHFASDVRPTALKSFLERAIQATHFLEQDTYRRLPKINEMGAASQAIDVFDTSWEKYTPSARKTDLSDLEEACIQTSTNSNVRSISTHVWDAFIESHETCSNGYSAGWQRTSFGRGAEITLVDDDGRLPEGYDYRSTRHYENLPSSNDIALTALKKAKARQGSKAIESGRLPLLLENRVAGRLLSVLIGPLSGKSIYEQRSCLNDQLGKKIGSSSLCLYDDPLVERGLSSRPFDGDGFATKKRTIMEDGILNMYFIDLYNSRRLGVTPTTGSTSNLVIPSTNVSREEILSNSPKIISVEGFLGGNTNPITGDFSFGITGKYFENGEFVQGISEMNLSGNLFEMLERFQTAANDTWTYGSYRVPSLLFDDMQF
jgi:PmbA protein